MVHCLLGIFGSCADFIIDYDLSCHGRYYLHLNSFIYILSIHYFLFESCNF